jgi:hydroxymethylpyrimidine pyrophosphatase-like HAD family hydrolase
VRIFVDVDGTLTTQQRGNSIAKSPVRKDVVKKVKRLAAEGHEIIIWSGDTAYAKRVAELLQIPHVAAVGKPDLIIDNEDVKWGGRLRRRMMTPEAFLAAIFPEPKK